MCQQWRVSSIHITITLLQIAHRTLPRMEIHCLVVLKSHLWPNLGRMIRVNSGQVFMRLNQSYVFSYKKTYYVHDYIIYQYSRDCIELPLFLNAFQTIVWFLQTLANTLIAWCCCWHCKYCTQLCCIQIKARIAILHELDTSKLSYSFIALLSLDQLFFMHEYPTIHACHKIILSVCTHVYSYKIAWIFGYLHVA